MLWSFGRREGRSGWREVNGGTACSSGCGKASPGRGSMDLLGARMTEVGEGTCVVEVPYSDGLAQQQRYFHGAVAGAIADSAGGYSALTLAPEGREVLTVEYKINFLAPARGEKLVARGGGLVRRSQVVRLQGRGVRRLRRGRRDAVRRAPTDHSHHLGVN
jgi:uncharacterized protein (TIGR00369 family)